MKKLSIKFFIGLYILGLIVFALWWDKHPNPKNLFDIKAIPVVWWGLYAPIAYIIYRIILKRRGLNDGKKVVGWGLWYLIGLLVSSMLAFLGAALNPGDPYAGMNIFAIVPWLIGFPILSGLWYLGKSLMKKA